MLDAISRPQRLSTATKVTTQSDPSHPVAKNLLQQNFTAKAPNRQWASDITYIDTQQGWLYLAVVMNLYSRRIVGWSIDRCMSRYLVIDALTMALDSRMPERQLIHHSDRGAQYTSDDFRNQLVKHGIECFYNRQRIHGYIGNISPVDFERQTTGLN